VQPSFKVEGRSLLEGFKRWCDNAAAAARERVLDTCAHARALATMAELLERAETVGALYTLNPGEPYSLKAPGFNL
jgi:hypothetical protein